MLTRADLNYGLAAFGIQIPERFDLDATVAKLTQRPATSAAIVVVAGAVLMHHFEKDHNRKLATLAEGDITHLHIGFKRTMDALFLKELAANLPA